MYFLPPSTISTSLTMFLSTIVKFGEKRTSGLRVVSAEKSKPGSSTLNSTILPIDLESGMISALTPAVDAILTNLGSFL